MIGSRILRRKGAHASVYSRHVAPPLRSLFAWSASLSLALGLVGAGCTSTSPATSTTGDAGACLGADFPGAPLGVHCGALVDREGRTVLLHGMNARVAGVFDVTFDDGRAPLEPIPTFTTDDARRLRAIGFNALRLPINWSAIEPKDGGFDDAYLDRVAAVVETCKSAGLFVLLDLHQDAWSKEIGEDGAPLWAITPAPTTLLGGPLDDLEARRLSKQVIAAFETFFGDSPDGLRLRDRYAKMAAHVAMRFANDTAVVGLELFNEPIAVDATLPGVYAPMIAAVRAAAPAKLIFFEPSSTRNVLDKSPLGAGSLGPGTVYAPHVYTLAFAGDDTARNNVTKEGLRLSNVSAREEAESYEAPLVITEFGFDPRQPSFARYVRWQMELEDEMHASSFYWVWKEQSQGGWGLYDYDAAGVATERPAVVGALSRVRLEAAAGRIVSVAYDADAKRFEAHIAGEAGVTAPNVVSLGSATPSRATCDGRAVTLAPGPNDKTVQIACNGAGDHVLVLE
ncbi:MAG: Endoglycoceramidase [Myxococcaceae bacterium]|nr:Endoglycoceramidase [Myxococcaceae bacterium]